MNTADAPRESERMLAWALFDLRVLLSPHIAGHSPAPPEVRAAAELAYALHNLALSAMGGASFTSEQFVAALGAAERRCGEPFTARLQQALARGV